VQSVAVIQAGRRKRGDENAARLLGGEGAPAAYDERRLSHGELSACAKLRAVSTAWSHYRSDDADEELAP
jgi:hypothetical protein